MAQKTRREVKTKRRTHRRKRLSSRWERSLGICGGIILAAICIGLLQQRLYPVLADEAAAMLRGDIRQHMERVIFEEVLSSFPCGDLVTIERDQSGQTSAASVNIAVESRLKSEVLQCMERFIAEWETAWLSIPLGGLTSLVPDSAPKLRLPLRIESGGMIRAALWRDYEELGINQSRQRLWLRVEVPLRALFSKHVLEETVSMEILVGETVIVGAVPKTYFQF